MLVKILKNLTSPTFPLNPVGFPFPHIAELKFENILKK